MTTATYRGIPYNVEEHHKLNQLEIIKRRIEKLERLHQATIEGLKSNDNVVI